jgi:cell division protein FtsW
MSAMKIRTRTFFDSELLALAACIVGLGLVMVTSASIPIAEGRGVMPTYFVIRQGIALGIGLLLSAGVTYVPLAVLQRYDKSLLLFNLAALTFLLIPGITHAVNGSIRWIFIGPISIQISELTKLSMIIYIAGYLVRREQEVQRRISGFLKPMAILSMMSVLLLLEPDFGAAVVIVTTVMGMLFLGGVPFHRFLILLVFVLLALAAVSILSPYRIERMTAFLDPWADQFNKGYQLTQALIAFGRGGILGMGLGSSIQKLLYLPEPHTDFLFAVLAEELGLLGALVTLILLTLLVMRAFALGRRAIVAEQWFAGYLAYGIALWLGIQSLINIGVNVGLLPTKA